MLYGISAQSAANALQVEARNYAQAIEAAKHNNYQTGMKAGLEQQMDQARHSAVAQRQGVKANHAAIAAQQVKPPVPARQQVPASAVPGSKDDGPTASQTLFTAPDINEDDF